MIGAKIVVKDLEIWQILFLRAKKGQGSRVSLAYRYTLMEAA